MRLNHGWSTAAAALVAAVAVAPGASAQDVKQFDLGRGVVPVYVPTGHDGETPLPLIVSLHGYTGNGTQHENYFRFRDHIDTYGFMLAVPNGTVDGGGARFWNATDACCNFYGSDVDDSGYLLDLIDAIKDDCPVEERRVYVIGHSNGGFMSYRMACDHSETIAAIASLAGATFADPDDCAPATSVHTLQIHGTNDTVIRYEGGFIGGARYPGAIESAEIWAAHNGCDVTPDDSAPPIDLDSGISGDETLVTRYQQGCGRGGSSEVWSIVGGSHGPRLSQSFAPLVIEWLLDHPSPCGADFNGDGVADTRDVLDFLNAWSGDEGPADCNGDALIDTRDVLCFLAVWNEGC